MAKRSRQLDLDLRPAARWGGARRGAGRKRGPRPRDPHRRRAPLASRHPCHVTLKVRAGLPSLRSVRLVTELERGWREACERGRFRLVHYSVQADIPAVAAARTWLLAVGWRRHGLVDPDEVPGQEADEGQGIVAADRAVPVLKARWARGRTSR